MQYHLPSIKMWPIHFIRDVLSKNKVTSCWIRQFIILVLKKNQLVELHIPHYAELSVKKIYPQIKVHYLLIKILTWLKENVLHERRFFYLIVWTLFTNEIKEIFKKARAKRSLSQALDSNEKIKITINLRRDKTAAKLSK